jgi:hypothetical protein
MPDIEMLTVHAVITRGAKGPRALFLNEVDAERFKIWVRQTGEVVPCDVMPWAIPAEMFRFEGE